MKLVAVAVLAVAQVGAQDGLRRASTIEVRDLAGQPWVGATVTLVSNVFPGQLRSPHTDRVTARTGAKGRARVSLLLGRQYSAWATAALDGKSFRAAGLHPGVHAGGRFDLREEASFWRRRVRVSGSEAWKDRGPLRLVLANAGPMVAPVVIPVTGAEMTVPAMPSLRGFARVVARVRTKDGMEIGYRSFSLQRRSAPDSVNTVQEVTLRAPLDLRVRVTDKAGKPIAGATVERIVSYQTTLIGKTDAKGELAAQLPAHVLKSKGSRTARLSEVFIVGAPGYATVNHSARMVVGAARRAETTCTLEPGPRLRGRIFLREGVPAAGLPLALFTTVARRGREYHLRNPLFARTDDAGRFDVSGANRRWAWRLLAIPSPTDLAAVADKRTPVAPVVWLAGGKGTDAATPIGDVRLDQLRRLDVHVRSHGGEPARAAELVLGEPGGHRKFDRVVYFPVPLAAGRAGRTRLLVHPRGSVAFAASWRGGLGFAEQQLGGERGDALVELVLSETVRIHGRVVGPDGKGVAGVPIVARGRTFRLAAHPHIVGRLGRSWTVTTDESGGFEAQVPGGDVRLSARHFVLGGGTQLYASMTVKSADVAKGPLLMKLAPTRMRKVPAQIALPVRRK